jgi:allantoin racemase
MTEKTIHRLAILGSGDTPDGGIILPQPLNDSEKAFHPELLEVPKSIFPDSLSARKICVSAYYETGLGAEYKGYDGIYINTVGDYGLSELRRNCNIPVTGAGEGSIKTALQSGETFSIVTIWPPSMRFIYDEVLSYCDAVKNCLSIHHLSKDSDLSTLGETDNFVKKMQSCGLTSMNNIRQSCEESLNKDHAETIILGCTCMNPVGAILVKEGFPVIEPMVTGYQYLKKLIKQHM